MVINTFMCIAKKVETARENDLRIDGFQGKIQTASMNKFIWQNSIGRILVQQKVLEKTLNIRSRRLRKSSQKDEARFVLSAGMASGALLPRGDPAMFPGEVDID